MSILQNSVMIAGHISHAVMMMLLFANDTNDLVKYVFTPLILAGTCLVEHFPDSISKTMFSIFDPITKVLFLGFLFYAMYKKHERAENKTLAKSIVATFIALYALFIGVDFSGLPKDIYEDRLAQLHTSAYEHGHLILHVLLVAILFILNSIPNATLKAEARKNI
jgi:hypothetical protein